MPDLDYQKFKYSITCHTDDFAVVHCLRSLCEYIEENHMPQIGWGGTEKSDWKAAGNTITLRFTSPTYRDQFVDEANRLIAKGSWREVDRDNKG